jgi:hypothetical protein
MEKVSNNNVHRDSIKNNIKKQYDIESELLGLTSFNHPKTLGLRTSVFLKMTTICSIVHIKRKNIYYLRINIDL